jgi:hypothetical protein
MSDNKDQLESDEYQSEDDNEVNEKAPLKKRVLGKRGYNKPKQRRVKYPSKKLFKNYR